jgi:hypothetical protein
MNDKLLKVTFEYPDRTEWLDGEDAEKWLKACNGMCVLGWAHGNPMPEFKWHKKKK